MSILRSLSIIVFILIGVNAKAQNKLFLTKKTDPLVYSAPDYKNTWSHVVIPSVSRNSKYLSISTTASKTDMSDVSKMKMTMNLMGILLDMETGEFVKKVKNSSLFYDGDQLIKAQYEDIWDKPFLLSEVNAKVINNVTYSFVTPQSLQPISFLKIPFGEVYAGNERGFLKTMKMASTVQKASICLYKSAPSGLQKIGEYSMSLGTISQDKKKIAGGLTKDGLSSIVVYDIVSGSLMNEIKVEKGKSPLLTFINSKNQLISYYMGAYDIKTKSISKGLRIIDLNTLTEIKNYPDQGGTFVINDEATLLTVINDFGNVKFLDLTTFEFIGEDQAFHQHKEDLLKGTPISMKIGNGDYSIIGHSSGISKLVSTKEKRVIADIFVDENDWAIVAVDGRVDGTAGAFQKLEWRQYDANGKVTQQTSLDMLFSNFFTPNLLPTLLKDRVGSSTELLNVISKAPSVEITSPEDGFKTSKKEVIITVEAKENGDPIKEIQLYINDKLYGGDERGFKRIEENSSKTFTVSLVQGLNIISAKAISQNNYESPLDQIAITYTGQKSTANLHILAVGIDSYLNTSYNLNYAVADAKAIVDKIELNSTDIFKEMFVYEFYNKEAGKQQIVDQMNQIAMVSKPEDVFVFFYAGHGVMSEGANKEFYLALYDVTQLYGKDDLLKLKGLSAEELKTLTSNISAQKQMIILDACQSGGAVETFASRGAAEEKAIVQLARSSGAVLLASTGSEQFATEFQELGHGVFTYALLNGLSGKADGGSMDNKITVKELEAYINDRIPELSSKYHGQAQFPRSWSRGQDFPVVIVK